MADTSKQNHQTFMPQLSLLTLSLAGVLTLFTVVLKQGSIETSLIQSVRKALANADLPAVQIRFEGRDGILEGELATAAQTDAVMDVAATVTGVRTISSRLQILPPDAATAPENMESPARFESGVYVPSRSHTLEMIDLSGVHFAPATSDLVPESLTILDNFLRALQDFPGVTIEIAVHTDSQGSPLGQLTASRERAEALKQYFISRGIPRQQLVASGYGSTRPLVNTTPGQDQSRNQRVEITVLKE
ncbi:MAG: OmpA family protein [Thiothrix sp.]|nr:OmpA family protein [Thiothrix sp.]HPQ96520.1 OmpA family protein [Thiolinea sp.]